jgi:hypothetical protein
MEYDPDEIQASAITDPKERERKMYKFLDIHMNWMKLSEHAKRALQRKVLDMAIAEGYDYLDAADRALDICDEMRRIERRGEKCITYEDN